jgi:hypothetical protein
MGWVGLEPTTNAWGSSDPKAVAYLDPRPPNDAWAISIAKATSSGVMG